MFSCAIVGKATHPNDDLSALGEERLRLIGRTTGHRQEVIARCTVHLNVPVADVVLVALQSHVAVLLRHETHQGFAVPSSLGR